MTRATASKCSHPSGRHKWVDITTKDNSPRKLYACVHCKKEVLE